MALQLVLVVLLVAACVVGSGCGGGPVTLLTADFQKDPAPAGWELGGPKGATPDGDWAGPDAAGGSGCLVARAGWWQSPPVPVEPFAYYRLRFRAKATEMAYVAVVFSDDEGNELVADAYDSVDASPDWRDAEVCFRGHALAVEARVRFQPITAPVSVDDVTVEAVGADEVRAWYDRADPVVPVTAPAMPDDRWTLLPRTMRHLAAGERLRVVILGDSIANDTANSLFETRLARLHPKARLAVVTSVRGGTGCEYYQADGRVAEYVLGFRPDLVIIAGISHGYDAEAIRSVVRQIRGGSQAEVLVLSGAVCPKERMLESFLERSRLPEAAAREWVRTWPERLRQMLAQERVEFLDMRSVWDASVEASGRPPEWFMRDPVHANARGKQVLGRILEGYFDPRGGRLASRTGED